MAIAIVDSVTVSIAADTIGVFNRMLRENIVARLTLRGSTSEKEGTSNTSSKVNPSAIILSVRNDIIKSFKKFRKSIIIFYFYEITVKKKFGVQMTQIEKRYKINFVYPKIVSILRPQFLYVNISGIGFKSAIAQTYSIIGFRKQRSEKEES
jgi:hypothetical protein